MHIFAPNGDYCLYIHEPEANNCFSIITQVITGFFVAAVFVKRWKIIKKDI